MNPMKRVGLAVLLVVAKSRTNRMPPFDAEYAT